MAASDPDGPRRGYVVVTFGSGPEPDWCTLSHCPMTSYGPFATNAEAQAFAEQLPPWQQAHVLQLDNPSTAIVAPATGCASRTPPTS